MKTEITTLVREKRLRQVGTIVFGGGINARYWIDEAKAQGYIVLIADGHAELYVK